MASQVLSGASNPTYTNNTGQNVRVIINYMRSSSTTSGNIDAVPGFGQTRTTTATITINWAGLSASASNSQSTTFVGGRSGNFQVTGSSAPIVIGKSLATYGSGVTANGAFSPESTLALPLEILLAPGQTFSAVCSVYNIIVIPENG